MRLEGAFKPRFFEDETLHATPNTATIKHLHQHWMPRVEWMHSELIKHLSAESILAAASKSASIRDVAPWFADYTREVRSCEPTHAGYVIVAGVSQVHWCFNLMIPSEPQQTINKFVEVSVSRDTKGCHVASVPALLVAKLASFSVPERASAVACHEKLLDDRAQCIEYIAAS